MERRASSLFLLLLAATALLLPACASLEQQLKQAEAAYAANPTPALEKEVDILEEELLVREERRAYDLENWLLCKAIYHQQGWPTIHMGHRHSRLRERAGRQKYNAFDVRSDLSNNHCWSVIPRDMWAG